MNKTFMKLWGKIVRFAHKAWTIAMHHPKALFLVGIMMGSFFGYTVSVLLTEASYRLTNGSVQLIGDANPALADKLKLDKNMGAYRFNADAITPEMTGESDPSKVAALLASQKQQTGGGGKDSQNLYSLDLPIDPNAGTKIYDTNSKTSFKLIPEFEMGAGRTESGRVVYPIDEGGQAVYTVKANGIKEDIVLQKSRGDELSFTYRLELPKTLEARLDDRGNLGIYSVDPMISSAIAGALQNGASSTDAERLKDVQDNGTKTHLTYLIPAPTIVQSGDRPQDHKAKAVYKLNGDQLTVSTSGLEQLTYPISIDPSVVVTSTGDFATGNDEGDISFDIDAISTAVTTNGTTGAWTATTSLTSIRSGQGSVAYNGYLYTIGGSAGLTELSAVEYTPINADGTIGNWTATTSLTGARSDFSSVAYSGYLYVLGGMAPAGRVATVEYAPINADGTIGNWTATTSLTGIRSNHASVAYNGYLYIAGGYNIGGTGWLATVEYASINANGTIGAWTATTSLTSIRDDEGLIPYNGYLYVIGGRTTGFTYLATVEYAPINANGTIGAWTATTSLSTARGSHSTMFYKGFLYAIGGYEGGGALATVEYAPVNANGTVGAWTATTSFTTARGGQASAAYNGYLYILGGYNSGDFADVQYAQIDAMTNPTMSMPSWTTSAVLLGLTSGPGSSRISNRRNHTSVAYNGHLFMIGGTTTTTGTTSVQSAPINADGTIGAWGARAAIPAVRQGHSSAISNGYVYVIGGQDGAGAHTTSVYYATLNLDGTVGTWTTNASVLPSARSSHTSFVNNGYVYLIGGLTTGNGSVSTVSYAPINANNSIGAWTSTTALPAARAAHTSVFYNGFVYVLGGTTGTYSSAVLYAPVNTNGTIGTWATTTSMSGPRGYFSAELFDGHIFIFGGYTGSLPDLNTTEYAKINADGTIGTWTAGSSFTNARDSHATAMYRGRVYLAGGFDSAATPTYHTDIQYVQLTYARPGGLANVGTTSVWTTTTSSNLAVYGQATTVYNNYVYIIGGFSTVYVNSVRYAPINANGTIGAWTTSPNVMTLARFNAAAVAYKGYLYVSGGQQAAGTFTNTVEYAPINADGTIGTWTASANTVTTARYGHVSVAHNGKLYVVGGGSSTNVALGDVKYATINANGSIGTFADTTATTANRDTDGFIYGGRLYITGGLNGTMYSNTVRYAMINTDGTLGTWTTSYSEFTGPRSRHAMAAINGYMYIFGGASTLIYSDLQYAPINADGSIGTWKYSNTLNTVAGAPAATYYHTAVAHNGRLYSFAGNEGTGTAQSATYTTALNTPAISARYSKLINFGSASTLNSIVTNGTLPADQDVLMFRTAGVDGLFGAWQLPSVLSGAPIANVQYVMYRTIFDDSSRSDLFSTSGRSSVTDITVDYTPPVTLTSENRLRQNKYFDASGVLQPLQTQ